MTTNTDTNALVGKLRYMGRQYAAGQVSRGGSPGKHYLEEAADTIELLTAEAASFHMAYRVKCDEQTKAQAVEIERLTRERDEAEALLEDWVGSFADTIEGGEADPLVIATRAAIATTKATT